MMISPMRPSFGASCVLAVRRCFERYVGFAGRAGATEFWVWHLCVTIVTVVLRLTLPSKVALLVGLVFTLPGYAVSSRRLHDVGKSAWNILWVFTIIGGFYVLYLYVQPSETGVNRFGEPDPLRAEKRVF